MPSKIGLILSWRPSFDSDLRSGSGWGAHPHGEPVEPRRTQDRSAASVPFWSV